MEDIVIIQKLERLIASYGRSNFIHKDKLNEFIDDIKEKLKEEKKNAKPKELEK